MSLETVIDAKGISKSFQRGIRVLDDVSVSLRRGEMVALIGASGCGKSTLIRAIAGLIAIDGRKNGLDSAGHIAVMGKPIQQNGRLNCSRALRARIGVIFQQFNLVPRLTLLTNVCFGLLGQLPMVRGTLGQFSDADKRRAMQALARVGIAEHALKRASELSGGQQQPAALVVDVRLRPVEEEVAGAGGEAVGAGGIGVEQRQDAAAGLQQRPHPRAGPAAHQAQMPAVRARQKLDDGGGFAMPAHAQHDAFVGPFHAVGIAPFAAWGADASAAHPRGNSSPTSR